MENNQQKAPKLTPEQAIKLKGMLKLSKVTRLIFFVSILLGVMVSVLASVFMQTMGNLFLIGALVIFLVAVVCAVILNWNIRRIKGYLHSLGIKI